MDQRHARFSPTDREELMLLDQGRSDLVLAVLKTLS
jgi:hypothetical protein